MDKPRLSRGPAYWALQVLQCLPDRVFALDVEGRILMANRAMAHSYGYSSGDAFVGKTVFDLFPVETAATLHAMDMQVIQTRNASIDQEYTVVDANGRRRWVKASRIPLYDDDEKIVGLVCTSRDITESKESDELLLVQANLLDMIAQSAPITEIFRKIVSIVENYLPAMMASIQLTSTDGRRLMKPTAPSTPDEIVAVMERDTTNSLFRAMMSAIEIGQTLIFSDVEKNPEFDDVDALPKHSIRAFWCVPILSLEGQAIGALSLFSTTIASPTTAQSDVLAMASNMVSATVERQQTEERNKFLASHDVLTGLPNRMMFESRLVDKLEEAEKSRRQVGVAFFDLDNFKAVNDSLGHAAGDFLLKTVAERARHGVRSGDLVARLGGDEFVMFLDNLSDQDDVNEKRFEAIRDLISAPINLEGHTRQVTCSMGVAYFPNHACDSSTLIAYADKAMYCAKQSGRDNIQFFDRSMSSGGKRRHRDGRKASDENVRANEGW